jgi:unsaturated rhamnogalacturonyl hydrolase
MIRSKRIRAWLIGGLVLSAAGIATAVPQVASAASTRYEAETGTISSGTIDSNHAGFTGSGFVNLSNAVGSYLELTIPANAAATVTLTFRYSNGTTADRPMTITVNGAVVASAQSFPTTGNWDTWATASVTATFNAGTNTVRATSNTSDGGPNLDSLTVTGGVVTSPSSSPTVTPTGGVDWSVKMVDSTMSRFTPSTLGGWGYTEGLYLYGQYLVYQRTHNPAYLTYIQQWADRFVGSDGSISNSFNNLDSMEAGNILVILYNETHQSKYLTAASRIWHRLMDANTTYPKTTDGGFEHGTSRPGQLWLDGTFMSLPFLLRYGQATGGSNVSAADAMAVKQLLIYGSHLVAPNGLLWHAYDEMKAQSWVVPGTSHSPEFWCRAIGWYGITTVMTLDTVPANQPNRGQMLTILQNLVAAMKTYQDPASGRWFQVVDKGSMSNNWTETSCSAMYTYIISRSVQQGYVHPSYKSVAAKGYAGVLGRISLGSDGRTNLTTISEGTNVGDYSYYINRARNTNDQHGLGSFLIMNEQMRSAG